MLVEAGVLLNASEYRVRALDHTIKKLIELVVLECSGVCNSVHERHVQEFGDYFGETYAAICRDAIKERFGVK
jgi:hypothetical protein